MYHIEYAILNYYHSPISDECLCIGVLFHNITTGQRDFKYISNFQRFHAFDDEADIDFVKLYLRGIKEEIKISGFNYNKKFNLASYIRTYANEFRFSSVKTLLVNEDENYVEDLSKVYLKYDLAKSQRLNDNEKRNLPLCGKSAIELKVDEIKLQIKVDLDTYIKKCVLLQKDAINYDSMILENATQQI